MTPPAGTVLIVGCGYLGRRAAARWVAAGRRVVALTRGRAAELAALGVEPVVGEVLDPASLTVLPAVDTLLYAVGLDRSAGRSMRDVYVGGLANVLAAVPPPRRFVYVSSTGVYGQTGGEWVNETAATDPLEESGRVVLEAERTLRERLPEAIILRFAGIYGPGRVLRRAALLAGDPLVGDAEKYLNLIHVEDGAATAVAAAERGADGATYNVADALLVTRRDFYTLAAELLGAPPAAFVRPVVLPVEANRRIDAAKIRAALGIAPQYADFRSGLRDAIRNGERPA